MFDEKCNCGKPARYTHLKDGEYLSSCNKYDVCKTYQELENELLSEKDKFSEVLSAARDLAIFREGTEHYQKALEIIKKFDL